MINNEASLLHLIYRIYQLGSERLAKALPEGLKPRQLVVLRAVDASPGTSHFGIVHATGMDRSTTSMVMKRLIARKLVKRRRDQMDARTYVLQLTDDGRAALTYGLAALKQVETLLLKELAGKDQTHLW